MTARSQGKVPKGYDNYRRYLKSLNIGLHENLTDSCTVCAQNKIHVKTCKDQGKCAECKKFQKHHQRYVEARELYQKHSKEKDPDHLVFAVDMQKVVLLPRYPGLKEVVFCPRLVTLQRNIFSTSSTGEP